MTANGTHNLAKLFQIVSPALPVGAFAYSQGLETAIEQGYVTRPDELSEWCEGVMQNNLVRLDLPVLRAMLASLKQTDMAGLFELNLTILSFRETSELKNESTLMAKALLRLLNDLEYDLVDFNVAKNSSSNQDVDWVCAFALAVHLFEIETEQALLAYLWSWLENQVAAAIKLVPLGQTQGQRVLLGLGDRLPVFAQQSLHLNVDEISNLSPGLAILSSQHETQYSRLFRS